MWHHHFSAGMKGFIYFVQVFHYPGRSSNTPEAHQSLQATVMSLRAKTWAAKGGSVGVVGSFFWLSWFVRQGDQRQEKSLVALRVETLQDLTIKLMMIDEGTSFDSWWWLHSQSWQVSRCWCCFQGFTMTMWAGWLDRNCLCKLDDIHRCMSLEGASFGSRKDGGDVLGGRRWSHGVKSSRKEGPRTW